MEKNSCRMSGYDNVKFLLIVAVAMGHTIDYFTDESLIMRSIYIFIYTFHMPLFIFLSGLFQKQYTDERTLNWNRVIGLVMIGFLLKMILAALNIMWGNEITFETFTGDGVPWYMFALAAEMVLMYACRNVRPALMLTFSVLLACFVGYDATIGDYLYLSRIIIFFPFYALGYYLKPQAVMQFAKSLPVRIASAVYMVFMIGLCFWRLDVIYVLRPLLTARNAFDSTILAMGGGTMRLLCYLISLGMGLAIISLMPNRTIPVLTTCGQRTLQVYFWHRGIVGGLVHFGVAEYLLGSLNGGVIALLLVPVALCFILSVKWLGFPTEHIMRRGFVNR